MHYTEERRINYAQSSRHEYNLKDHLGNTRVCFTPNPANPTDIQPKILQQTNYYAYRANALKLVAVKVGVFK